MTAAPSMAEVLAEHVPMRSGTACACGWSAGLSLNDTRSDAQQHLRHLAQALADAGFGHVVSVEYVRLSTAEKYRARAEAAEAQVAAVRAARAQHPTCDRHDDSPVSCGWKRVVLDIDAVLDGEGGR